MRARLFVFLQYVLPRFWLTALVYRLARIPVPAIKDFLITRFVSLYDVEIDEVELDVPAGFRTFNDFFIRELEDGARPIDASPASIVSPVDGTLSRSGRLLAGSIMQAKGIDYTLEDLLATDLEQAAALADGSFATITSRLTTIIACTHRLTAKLSQHAMFRVTCSVSMPPLLQLFRGYSAAMSELSCISRLQRGRRR